MILRVKVEHKEVFVIGASDWKQRSGKNRIPPFDAQLVVWSLIAHPMVVTLSQKIIEEKRFHGP